MYLLAYGSVYMLGSFFLTIFSVVTASLLRVSLPTLWIPRDG